MKKETIKKKLEEVKSQLKGITTDAAFADKLIDKMLSYKGQLDTEETIVHVPIKNVVNEYKGDTFEMATLKDGTAVYHVYGGLTVVANPNLLNLVGTIEGYIEAGKNEEMLTDEERKNYELDLSAFAYVMSLPMFCFSDMAFKYEIASKVVEFLREKTEEALNRELEDETREDIEDNNAFRDATMALEELKEELNKEANS